MALSVAKKQDGDDRGIQNVQTDFRYANGNIPGPHTVQSDNEKKLLGNTASNKTEQKSSEDSYSSQYENDRTNKILRNAFQKRSSGSQTKMTKSILSGFSRWMGLGVLIYICVIQFGFAVASAMLLGMAATYETGIDELGTIGAIISSTLESLQSIINGVSNLLIGTDIVFSLQSIALVFWLVSSLIVGLTFMSYYAWYRFMRIRPFSTAASFIVSTSCLFFSLMPFTNLFPWLLVWVLYINASTLFLRH